MKYFEIRLLKLFNTFKNFYARILLMLGFNIESQTFVNLSNLIYDNSFDRTHV